MGHSRPGRASSRSGQVRYPPKATDNTFKTTCRDGPLGDIGSPRSQWISQPDIIAEPLRSSSMPRRLGCDAAQRTLRGNEEIIALDGGRSPPRSPAGNAVPRFSFPGRASFPILSYVLDIGQKNGVLDATPLCGVQASLATSHAHDRPLKSCIRRDCGAVMENLPIGRSQQAASRLTPEVN